jgi:hypothetical protein
VLQIQNVNQFMYKGTTSSNQELFYLAHSIYKGTGLRLENSPFYYFQYLSTVVLMKWSYFFTFRIPAKVPNADINRAVPDFEKKEWAHWSSYKDNFFRSQLSFSSVAVKSP